MIYSLCESVHATGRSLWHIRPLTDKGKFLGGGIDTKCLCGAVKRGWDLRPELTHERLKLVHPDCRSAFIQRANNEG